MYPLYFCDHKTPKTQQLFTHRDIQHTKKKSRVVGKSPTCLNTSPISSTKMGVEPLIRLSKSLITCFSCSSGCEIEFKNVSTFPSYDNCHRTFRGLFWYYFLSLSPKRLLLFSLDIWPALTWFVDELPSATHR